jgi:hypothetical protein
MAEEDSGAPPATSLIVPSGGASAVTSPKEPSWYPVRSNPNEQSRWDGKDRTRRRHWAVGAGWTEVGVTPDFVPVAESQGPAPRISSNPYAPRTAPRSPAAAASAAPGSPAAAAGAGPGVTVANFLLLASGITMMLASVTTWVSSSLSTGGLAARGANLRLSSATSGVDPSISSTIGVNGYVTLTVGVVLMVFAGLMMVSDDAGIRVFAALFTLVGVGLGIYVVVRLLQKINNAHVPSGASVNIGWGALLVLSAAVVAALLAIFELRTR